MTTVSRFSRQNDAGLRALTVVLRENLVLVVVLVLESKALYSVKGCEKGPTVYGPCPTRIESLTICRCIYEDSTFSSVI